MNQRSAVVGLHPGGTTDVQKVIMSRRIGIGRSVQEQAGRRRRHLASGSSRRPWPGSVHMVSNGTTIGKLQFLERLYRQGYQSDVIDRSLDKIIALEIEKTQRELTELEERLRTFEQQYQMPSEAFYHRFQAGEMGDSVEVVEWSIFYDMRESVRMRLDMLEAESP